MSKFTKQQDVVQVMVKSKDSLSLVFSSPPSSKFNQLPTNLKMPPKRNQKSKQNSKQSSKAPSKAPSGAATPAQREEPKVLAAGLLGLNFGQSFSSVAIIDKVSSSYLLSQALLPSDVSSLLHRRDSQTALLTMMESDKSLPPCLSTVPRSYVHPHASIPQVRG